jgi:hypothetical protein
VGVTTDDEAGTFGVLGKLPVFIIADVGHGNDTLGQPLLPDVVDSFLYGLRNVEKLGSGTGARDPGSGLGGNANDGEVVLLEDLVGLDVPHEPGVVALDVGTNSWEGQVFQLELQVERDKIWQGYKQPVTHELSEVVITAVKFVVPQDKGIEAELVEGLSDLFAAVVREVQGSLRAACQKATSGEADQS